MLKAGVVVGAVAVLVIVASVAGTAEESAGTTAAPATATASR